MNARDPRKPELADTPIPQWRASDQDRERAVEQLHGHAAAGRLTADELKQRLEAAYVARTIGELAELMHDLPGQYTPALQADSGQRRLKRWFVAILGSNSRRVSFRLGRRAISVAIMADPDIDLCGAELDSDKVVLYGFALFGWPDIYIPDSVNVELAGFTLLGGDKERGSQHVPPANSPTVKLRSYGLIGGYTVWRLPPELHGLPYNRARQAARELPPGD